LPHLKKKKKIESVVSMVTVYFTRNGSIAEYNCIFCNWTLQNFQL